MRIFFITLLLLIICPLTNICFADDKSDCLNQCANDKRTADMYCPPAGGYTDEENKQCMVKSTANFTICNNACSPQVDQQPAPTQLPAKTDDDFAPTGKQL